MNKGQGLAASSLLFVAALFRPSLPASQPQVPSGATHQVAAPERPKPTESGTEPPEGPWLASCRYWNATNFSSQPYSGASTQGVPGETGAACDATEWGIPEPASVAARPSITAVIATLPDPVHSSLSLDFDRLIDVITLAAADNHYLIRHYWLPWTRKSSGSGSAPEDTEDPKQRARESQPGLLIMEAAQTSPNPRVIYLFLVAQTPALGVQGEQMRHALEAEEQLHRQHNVALSLRDPLHGVDVIGPNHSGSAASLRAALLNPPPDFDSALNAFHVVGITSTCQASTVLTTGGPSNRHIDYLSFGEDSELEDDTIERLFASPSPPDPGRVALLVESGTAYGSYTTASSTEMARADDPCTKHAPEHPVLTASSRDAPVRRSIVIHFPREISLLRNAQNEHTPSANAFALAADSYLHLSLKTAGSEDTIAHFSAEETPVSQEAQWMSIVRELKLRRTEVVVLSASNILDELFLAKNLHRDLPDARVVTIVGGDLLFTHIGDDASFVGTIVPTSYPLVDLQSEMARPGLHDFVSSWTAQWYNAVSYTLWDGKDADSLLLHGYHRGTPAPNSAGSLTLHPPPLWITAVGRDGYYPLSIASPCGSTQASILPVIQAATATVPRADPCASSPRDVDDIVRETFPTSRLSTPGLSWFVLCLAVGVLCSAHALVLSVASFWSPATRDAAIQWSDEPRRRAVYLHIATAMLLCMSVVVAVPCFFAAPLLHRNTSSVVSAALTLACGGLAVVATLRRTWPFVSLLPSRGQSLATPGHMPADTSGPHRPERRSEIRNILSDESLYGIFHGLALLAVLLTTGIWCLLCGDWIDAAHQQYLGRFFAYRCLYPASGLSPMLPVLLILLSWYLWAYFQTKRLRFSLNSRPSLPHKPDHSSIPVDLYVPQEALEDCSHGGQSCLYQNLTCLLITRQLVRRFWRGPSDAVNLFLACVYVLLFGLFVCYLPVHGLESFLRRPWFHLTTYEFLISALFYPLIVIAITGSLRMLVIWTSLRSGLLEPLERSPLRFAFSRLTNVSWMTTFRQHGVLEYWRDMTRSTQAMRQMLCCPELQAAMLQNGSEPWEAAVAANRDLKLHTDNLVARVAQGDAALAGGANRSDPTGQCLDGDDLPDTGSRAYLHLMCAIDSDYSAFSNALLAGVLIPHWTTRCIHPVESEPDAEHARDAAIYQAEPHILLAEEFLALRYHSLIRAVLINLRQLMSFVSASFVLTLLAWNSYPFQPRQSVDWVFTSLLFGLGSAIIWVFMQMHRNPILSRITGTQANELGGAFYLRLASFGAVPVLTWLVSQFPALSSSLSRLFQSGMTFAK